MTIRTKVQEQGNLLSFVGNSTWRAPEALPVLDGRYRKVGFDCESDGTDWRGRSRAIGYSVALEDGRRFYLPIGHRGGGNLDPQLVKRWAQRELRDKDVYLSEGKFDIQMARKDGIDLEAQGCRPHEVQFRAALLDDQRASYKLDDLSARYLDKRKLDLDRKSIWEMPASEVGPYAEQDGGLTLELGTHLDKLIEKEGLSRVCRLEDELIWCTCEMERNGVPLDIPKLTSWHADVRRRYAGVVREVSEKTGLKVNPNSGPDLAQLFNLLGLHYPRTAPTPKHESGQPSFKDSFLRTVNHPLVAQIRLARALDSLDSKYLGKYLKEQRDGYLHYKLHQLKAQNDEDADYSGGLFGTVSGRYSSSSVNIQQVFDKKRQVKKLGFSEYIIRELFIPRPGRLWVKADAMQIEYRLFAHYANSEKILARYRENPLMDYHVLCQEMVQRFRPIDRQDAKNINFAKLYCAGTDKLSKQLGVTFDEAQALVDLYDEVIPEAKALAQMAIRLARRRGWVRTILGRLARFPKEIPEKERRLHSALNRVIQGTAADIMKLKLIQVYSMRKELDLHLFFTVHDDVDGDVGSEEAALKLKSLLDEPVDELKLRVPILWDVSTGANWAAAA